MIATAPNPVPTDLLVSLATPPPSDVPAFRASTLELLRMFEELATEPVVPPGQSVDDLHICLERLDSILLMLEGATAQRYRSLIETFAPDLLGRFDRARDSAIAGAREHIEAGEDAIDALLAQQAREEEGPSIPFETIRRELGLA